MDIFYTHAASSVSVDLITLALCNLQMKKTLKIDLFSQYLFPAEGLIGKITLRELAIWIASCEWE